MKVLGFFGLFDDYDGSVGGRDHVAGLGDGGTGWVPKELKYKAKKDEGKDEVGGYGPIGGAQLGQQYVRNGQDEEADENGFGSFAVKHDEKIKIFGTLRGRGPA